MLRLHTYLPKPQANAEVRCPHASTPHVPWNLELIAPAVASRPSTNAASHCALVDQVCLVSMLPFSRGEQAQSFLTKSLDGQSFGVSPSLHDSNVHTHTSMYIIPCTCTGLPPLPTLGRIGNRPRKLPPSFIIDSLQTPFKKSHDDLLQTPSSIDHHRRPVPFCLGPCLPQLTASECNCMVLLLPLL